MSFQGLYREMIKIWARLSPAEAYRYGLAEENDIFSTENIETDKMINYIKMLEKDVFSRYHRIKLNELKSMIEDLNVYPPSYRLLNILMAIDAKKGLSNEFLVLNCERIMSCLKSGMESKGIDDRVKTEIKSMSEGNNQNIYERCFLYFINSECMIEIKDFFEKRKECLKGVDEIFSTLEMIPKKQNMHPEDIVPDNNYIKNIMKITPSRYPNINYNEITLEVIETNIKNVLESLNRIEPEKTVENIVLERPLFIDYLEHYDTLKEGIKNDIIAHTDIPLHGDVLISKDHTLRHFIERPILIDMVENSPYTMIYSTNDSTAGDILHKTVEAYIAMNLYRNSILPFPSFDASISGLITLMEELIFVYSPGNDSGSINMKREAHVSYLKDKLIMFTETTLDIMIYINGLAVSDAVEKCLALNVPLEIIKKALRLSIYYPMKAYASVCSYIRLRKEYDNICRVNPDSKKVLLKLFAEIHDMPKDMFSSRLKNLMELQGED